MTSGDQVRVEPSQLSGKAADISTPVDDVSAAPTAPCAFTFVQSATAQVRASAETLRSFVNSGNGEAARLAAVLNEAAKVYGQVDERTRAALEADPPRPVPADPVAVNPSLPPSIPAIEQPPSMEAMAGGDTGGYLDPKAAAQIIHSGNSHPMQDYADAATKFAKSLRDASDRYSLDGVDWHGTAAESAGDALLQHKQWMDTIADQYERLATQAQDLAAAQDKWAAEHPTVAEIEQVEQEMQQAIQNKDRVGLHIAQEKYGKLFAKSEEVLTGYSAAVTGKGLFEGVPKPPPGAAPFDAVAGNGDPRRRDQPQQSDPTQPGGPHQPGSGDGTGAPQQPTGTPSPAAQPMSAQQPAGQQPAGGAPSGGSAPSGGGAPSAGGAPSGGMPGGLPGGGPSTGTPKLPTDPSLRPAAAASGGGGSGAGGGGAGGGGASPLSPAVGAETVAPTSPAAARGGVAPAAAATAGGAMGGGMAPMGHGAGHNQGKEKRRDPNLAPDEDLYTEDRPWTEAVIGNRRRRDVQDGKEST